MFSWKRKLFYFILSLLGLTVLATSCSNSSSGAGAPAVIEQTSGGFELLEQEFSECDEGGVDGLVPSELTTPYRQARSSVNNYSTQYQAAIDNSQYGHQFSSKDKGFPLRGSWRQSKAEILDLVDRYNYNPATGKGAPLLRSFDLVLLVNVADRDENTPANRSAQRMQVLARTGTSNKLTDFRRVQTWPISSGRPCKVKNSKGEWVQRKILTPTGVYKFDPARMHASYKSQQWDDADMYESMFLYHQYQNGKTAGVAIHGTYKTDMLGRKDSGGCIRLYRDHSQCLFNTIMGGESKCLGTNKAGYRGKVPSLLIRNGEADPSFATNGGIEMDGYRVLIAIYNDENDLI